MNENPQEAFTRPVGIGSFFRGISLRTKAVLMLVMFLGFTIFTGIIISKERSRLNSYVGQLQAVHLAEENILGLYMSIAQATLTLNEHHKDTQSDTKAVSRQLSSDLDKVLSGLYDLQATYSDMSTHVWKLQQNQKALAGPSPHLVFSAIRENLHDLKNEVSQVNTIYATNEVHWMDAYNKSFSRLSIEWAFFVLTGVVALSLMVMFFVTRLALDIRRVQDRAMQIVGGYRGESMKITRTDELGSLMESVNKMQLALRQQELKVELSRQQEFHKEKMAAVGSVAAAVAHEINNPLSAIVGMSNEMCHLQETDQCGRRNSQCHPEMLQSHARRVMEITRQISEFSSPRSGEARLYDLNNLISTTAKFVSFDRRFRSAELVLSLDPQLPAVFIEGDHVTQVVMNLLINAVDAMDGQTDPKPRIDLETSTWGNDVVIRVKDNGPGIDPAIFPRVFEEFFTTKPVGKGSGIGLALSKSLIESSGGTIAMDSQVGAGVVVTIRLPLSANDSPDSGKGQ